MLRSRRAKAVGLLAAGMVALAGAAVWSPPSWLFTVLARLHPGCLYQAPVGDSLVGLTIDDGPHPVSTSRILDQLERHHARATFFLISGRLRGQKEVVDRLVREGHELGNHFTRDHPSIRLDSKEFELDLLQAHRALTSWREPVWARPASGWYTREMVEVMRRHGYRCALGSVYPFDVLIPSVPWAASYILRNVRPGAIVVLHEGGDRGLRTERVLSQVLPELSRRGYRVVSLSELTASAPRRTRFPQVKQ